MHSALRRVLLVAVGLLVAAMFVGFAVAGWFDHRSHSLSGVPASHFGVIENGRYFYVHRGGPPVEQRPHFPLTAEQYRLWEENDNLSSFWGDCSVLSFLAVFLILAWLGITEPGRGTAAEPSAPADRPSE